VLQLDKAKLTREQQGSRVSFWLALQLGASTEVEETAVYLADAELRLVRQLRYTLWQHAYAEIFALVPRLCRAARKGARTEAEVAEIQELTAQFHLLSQPSGSLDLPTLIRNYSQLLLDLIRDHPELGLSSRMELSELNRAVQ